MLTRASLFFMPAPRIYLPGCGHVWADFCAPHGHLRACLSRFDARLRARKKGLRVYEFNWWDSPNRNGGTLMGIYCGSNPYDIIYAYSVCMSTRGSHHHMIILSHWVSIGANIYIYAHSVCVCVCEQIYARLRADLCPSPSKSEQTSARYTGILGCLNFADETA